MRLKLKLLIACLKMFFREREAVFWTLFFPIFMIVMFGFVRFDSFGRVEIGVVNLAGSQGNEVIQPLRNIETIRIHEASKESEIKALEKGERDRSLLANTFEALIAAIYLDGGLEETKQFVHRFFKQTLEDVVEKDFHFNDFKSLLQEKLQSMGEMPPDYGIVLEEGPHHQKIFHVDIRIRNVAVASGTGSTKKEAEQDAARKAYEQLLSGELDYLLARRENPVS